MATLTGTPTLNNRRAPLKVVDLFAGAGGWTTGATQAGAQVLMAINHWPRAVETHSRNHPDTQHICQDLALFDHSKLPDHELLIASPSCVGHTPARGRERKHHDATRATAWCVVDAVEAKRPAQLVVENVPAFQDWELYPVWKMALAALGYALEEHLLDASEWGVPQQRVRLIVTGRRGAPPVRLRTPGVPGASAHAIIDWSSGEWGSAQHRAARTMTCIADGRARFGERFLVPYFGNTRTARSIERPVATVTTKDRFAIVDGARMRMPSIEAYRRAMSFPEDYALTGTREERLKQLGNAVPPELARRVVQQLAEAA
jgi:DNA (cytosine-5)-methyltransferase 1